MAEAFPKDKQYHTMAGIGIYFGCLFVSGITRNNGITWLNEKTCLVPVYVAAVGKEVYDKHYGGTAEVADAAMTVAVPTGGYILYSW